MQRRTVSQQSQQGLQGPTYANSEDSWGSRPSFNSSRHQSKAQWGQTKRRQRANVVPRAERVAAPTSPNGENNPMVLPEQGGPLIVKLGNLPRALCQQHFLEAMLEQAGLTNSIMGCVLGQDQDTGSALICLQNQAAAEMCMEHFSGCAWEKGGEPVTASMMDGPMGPSPQQHEASVPQPEFNAIVEKTDGRLPKPRTKINNERLPVNASQVVQPPWVEFGQNDFVKQDMTWTQSDEGSTFAGSSGRPSCDTTEDMFAYDTDDGF